MRSGRLLSDVWNNSLGLFDLQFYRPLPETGMGYNVAWGSGDSSNCQQEPIVVWSWEINYMPSFGEIPSSIGSGRRKLIRPNSFLLILVPHIDTSKWVWAIPPSSLIYHLHLPPWQPFNQSVFQPLCMA